MNFRVIALASCVALGSIALGGKAQAQSVDVVFNGVVGPVCSVAKVTPGVLRVATAPANLSVLTSTVAQSAGASSGSFELTCSAGANILLNVPTVLATSVAAASTANYGGNLNDGSTLLAGANKGGPNMGISVVGPVTNKVYTVNHFVNNGAAPLPNGKYDYKVNLFVTAQ